jgi:predicted transposase YbfD/YdcC
MNEFEMLRRQFGNVTTVAPHTGYYYKVKDALIISILGSLCGLSDMKDICQWSENTQVRDFLRKTFEINYFPCYSWFTVLMRLVNPDWLNRQFSELWQQVLPKDRSKITVSFDGKTVCATEAMGEYALPMHIVSAQIAELGITIGQLAVEGKTNEIPTVRALLEMLDVQGCLVVADALNCQRKTAEAVIRKGADYLFSVKKNQENLKDDIEEWVQDEGLRGTMDTATKTEIRSDRKETRTAYTSTDIDWMPDKDKWANLASFGAIHTSFVTKNGVSSEWHYYISSRALTAKELLYHARAEWSVEVLHWFLDVHWNEDGSKIRDDNLLKVQNILKKNALNLITLFKKTNNLKMPVSRILFANLLDCTKLLDFIDIRLQN